MAPARKANVPPSCICDELSFEQRLLISPSSGLQVKPSCTIIKFVLINLLFSYQCSVFLKHKVVSVNSDRPALSSVINVDNF